MFHSVANYCENPVNYKNKVYAEYHNKQKSCYLSFGVYIPALKFFFNQNKTHAEQRCDCKCEIHQEVKEIEVSQLS